MPYELGPVVGTIGGKAEVLDFSPVSPTSSSRSFTLPNGEWCVAALLNVVNNSNNKVRGNGSDVWELKTAISATQQWVLVRHLQGNIVLSQTGTHSFIQVVAFPDTVI